MQKLKFDDFENVGFVGAGTVGSITKVREKKTGQEYALKLLSPGISQDKLIAARFEREILVLSKLNHPNIVSYIGHGKHDGQLFYVMELLNGGTLKSVTETTGPLSWHEAADCGRQIASALQHAHNHGIIHRDLKPGNVFLASDAQPKLGDFGIARDQNSKQLTETGLTVGTYAYMPPELVTGESNITGKADLYALGCLLFELITGRTPFVGDGFAQLFEQHLKSTPPRLRELAPATPIGLDELVNELLAKKPESRPFNARAVQGRLNAVLEAHFHKETVGNGHNVAESSAAPVAAADLGAGEIRWGQDAIRQRLEMTGSHREVSWVALGVIAATLVGALLAIAWLGGR